MYATDGTNRPWSFALDKRPSTSRSRFNLLLLEHGEHYLQDYSCFYFPVEPNRPLPPADVLERRGIQGRLKVCSRSLVFEPLDEEPPLLRYPYQKMPRALAPVSLDAGISAGELEALGFRPLGLDGSSGGGQASVHGGDEYFEVLSTRVVEMKAHNRVGPFVVRDAAAADGEEEEGGPAAPPPPPLFRAVFRLVHSPLGPFLAEAGRWRRAARGEEEEEGEGEQGGGGGGGGGRAARERAERAALGARGGAFDPGALADFRERPLLPPDVRADRVTPLLTRPGAVMVTDKRFYFQPAPVNNAPGGDEGDDGSGGGTVSYPFARIKQVLKRRHMLCDKAIEIYLVGGSSVFLSFESSYNQQQVYDVLMEQPELARLKTMTVASVLQKWQSREISNYDYLAYLNSISGRSINDLTQYPVFPWVLKDYSSPSIDLKSSDVYRDLSKPIGALNEERLRQYKERYDSMPGRHGEEIPPGIPKPFLYGTHYSTPGYVLFYLLREAPEHMLCLQNGKFDIADRLFLTIKDTWESVLHNQADIKELIPEFYDPHSNGDFLVNKRGLNLGTTQDGKFVADVELPPWASTPLEFIMTLRSALESEQVSNTIHQWIDLIFGYKQQGEEAVNSDNLFYYLTYEGAIDLEKVTDPFERAALESQISEFGQTPKQIFAGPHPSRGGQCLVHLCSEYSAPGKCKSAQLASVQDSIATKIPEQQNSLLDAHQVRSFALRHNDIEIDGLTAEDDIIIPRPLEEVFHPDEMKVFAKKENGGIVDQADDLQDCRKPVLLPISAVAEKLYQAHLHRDSITDLYMDKDGSVLCTASKDCSLKVSCLQRDHNGDVSDITLKRNFTGSDLTISCCTLTRNSRNVVGGSWDNSLFMYSIESASIISMIQDAHDDSISCMELQGEQLVTGSWDATVKIWKILASGISPCPLLEFFELESSIYCCALDGEGEKVAAGAENGMVHVWDCISGASLGGMEVIESGLTGINTLAWCGPVLVCASSAKLFLADVCSQTLLSTVETGVDEVLCLVSTPSMIISGNSDGSINVWAADVEHHQIKPDPLTTIDAHAGSVSALFYCQNQNTLVSGSDDCSICIWKLSLS